MGGPGDPQALYDVDVGDDIIVRCHRKIVYPNGTIYSGFVDCGFECMQKQYRCVKADDMQLIATGHSMGAINAAFEREAEDSKTQLVKNPSPTPASCACVTLVQYTLRGLPKLEKPIVSPKTIRFKHLASIGSVLHLY